MKEVKVIFVEDYTKMSKEEFTEYIKKIYNEGFDDGFKAGQQCPTINSPITWEPYVTTCDSITTKTTTKI